MRENNVENGQMRRINSYIIRESRNIRGDWAWVFRVHLLSKWLHRGMASRQALTKEGLLLEGVWLLIKKRRSIFVIFIKYLRATFFSSCFLLCIKSSTYRTSYLCKTIKCDGRFVIYAISGHFIRGRNRLQILCHQ